MRYAVKIFYDGEPFHGFQQQPKLLTIEGEIIKALRGSGYIKDKKEANLNYSGRTDKGVHSIGQTIAFNSLIDEIDIFSLNDYLPFEIVAWAYIEVEPGFNARKNAISRWYRYVAPFSGEQIDKMVEASSMLQGKHNFSAFCKSGEEREKEREITYVKLVKDEDNIVLDIAGKSFLWRMVRNIWSALEMVGKGKLTVNDFKKVLEGERNIALSPADPLNLVLMDVYYNTPFIVSRFSVKEIIYYLEKKLGDPEKRRPIYEYMLLDLKSRIEKFK